MKLCFAPMDGITNCATRLITSQIFEQYKHPDDELQLWTEFMNADGFIINPSKVVRHIMTTPEQKPIAQIYGGNSKTLFQTAEILVHQYADQFSGIELNTGCPSNTVMKCGGGSDMLRRRPETLEIIKGLSTIVKKEKKLTFSVKSRAGLNEDDKSAQLQFLTEIAPFCDLISIHGRTLKQLYMGEADFAFIQQVKSQLSCPVVANGGITSYLQAQELSQKRDFDGVMIGQGAIGNPWVFTPHEPTLEEKIVVIKEHLELMIACDLRFEERGEKVENYQLYQPTLEDLEQLKKEINPEAEYRAIVEFRKYLFQYIKGIPNSREWKQEVIPVKTYAELMRKLEELQHLL
ncbi:MAG: hypothetical protein DLD55_01395 [candidate division SR1 bacterium]|nr:MAG: hypothetical protein DLD55_01395 [candidate division SR1 bacterium]